MFVDIVSSTPLAEALDTERWRDLLLTFHDICDRAIDRYGGAIASRMGDGLMAHFGLERPHEDDPRRALLAGLAIQAGLAPLTKEVAAADGVIFEARVGVHLGQVLITEISDRHEIIGSTANETARIESAATPGTVAASRAVQDAVGNEFRFEPSRTVELKGVGKPMEIATVVGPAAAQREPAATPLMGRYEERLRLLEVWEAARTAHDGPRAAVIRGEAGIGKSRLAEFGLGAAAVDGARRLVFEAREYDASLALHPVAGTLEHHFGLFDLHDEEDRLRALTDELFEIGASDAVGALGQLVGLSRDLLGDAATADAVALHEILLQGTESWIAANRADGALVVLFEDVQWADDLTLELISRLITDDSAGLLVLMTARPEFEVPWPDDAVATIELGPLEEYDIVRMAEFSLGDAAMSDEHLAAIIAASDGNPLYVDRLLDAVGSAEVASDAPVPQTLEHLLTTIVEAPGVDQQLVGTLAAIGRRIEVRFVASVLDADEGHVQEQLQTLCNQGILDRVETSQRPTFIFHHALVQAAAYDHQLSSDRKIAHARIAETIEASGGSVELDSRSIARHLDLAGRHRQSLPHYLSGSLNAHRRASTLESRRLAERGLEVMHELAECERDTNLEIELELQRGLCIFSLEGYGSDDAMQSAARVRSLASAATDPALVGRALVDMGSFYMSRGRRADTGEIVEELKKVVADSDPYLAKQFEALHIWHLGQYERSRELYLEVIDYREGLVRLGPADPLVALPADNHAAAYIQMAPISWHLGDADAAFEYLDKAIKRAQTIQGSASSFSEAFAMSWHCYLHGRAGDYQAALDTAADMLAICRRKGLMSWAGQAYAQTVIAQARLDPNEVAEATLSAIISGVEAQGATTMRPFLLAERAILRGALGRSEQALQGFDDAVEMALTIQEVQELAEIHRLRADARRVVGDDTGAKADLLRSREIAVEQGAVVYGLRSLCYIVETFEPAESPDTLAADLSAMIAAVATPAAFPEVSRAQEALTVVAARSS